MYGPGQPSYGPAPRLPYPGPDAEPNPQGGTYGPASGAYPNPGAYRPPDAAYPGAHPYVDGGFQRPDGIGGARTPYPPADPGRPGLAGGGRVNRVGRGKPPPNRRMYALLAAALAGVVVVVGTIGLVAGGGGAGAEDAQRGRQNLQGFVNGAANTQREAAAAEDDTDAAGKAGKAEEAAPPQGETAQVRLVGPSRATAGRAIRVVAAFRGLPEGAGLRAYVQAMTPDGRVGATRAVATCRLDKPGQGGTLTGTCAGVAAGSYRLAVMVEQAAQRPGDFPPVDVGRLIVAPAGAEGSNQGTSGAATPAAGGGAVPSPDQVQAVEQRMVALTNQARREAGVGPLTVDSGLVSTSRDWSCDMAAKEELQHDPNFADSGAQGENVAFRTDPGDDVALLLHNQFMNSPGHRDNILNARWGEVGIGFCARNGFWVTERFAP